MTLKKLVARATDKDCFARLEGFIDFARTFLEFAATGLQAVIVSRNEPHYNFWQFKNDGHFNVSRPVNSSIMYAAEDCGTAFDDFAALLGNLREAVTDTLANRATLNRTIYTLQQCIGTALDALAQLDWVGQLEELPPVSESRFVLLANPDATLLAPLMKLLLLDPAPATQSLWENAQWSAITLRDTLQKSQ